jgi:small subunit ribosomal protein S3
MLKLTLHTAKPGIIIGRGGRGVEDIRAEIERMVKQKVHINVQEIRQPELDATLVAENIASQIERRVAFKRAVRQTVQRSMKMGAQGIRALISGRLGGAEMSRSYADRDGKIPLHTLRADIDYGFTEARTASGNIGVKVWIYRGDVLPEAPAAEQKAVRPAAAAERPRRGWRRVGAARKAQTEDTQPAAAPEEAAAEETAPQDAAAGETAPEVAEPAAAVAEGESGAPQQPEPAGDAGADVEEQERDADAVEGEAPEADEGPQAG